MGTHVRDLASRVRPENSVNEKGATGTASSIAAEDGTSDTSIHLLGVSCPVWHQVTARALACSPRMATEASSVPGQASLEFRPHSCKPYLKRCMCTVGRQSQEGGKMPEMNKIARRGPTQQRDDKNYMVRAGRCFEAQGS